MILKDSLEGLADFWKEFRKVKVGLVGLGLLFVFLFFAVFGTALIPFPEAPSRWRDINYWQDNPQSAPPVWTNFFASKKGVESSILSKPKVTEETVEGGAILRRYAFTYDYPFDRSPRDVLFRFSGTGSAPVSITVERPDGLVADVFASQMRFGGTGAHRVSIGRDCAQSVIGFIRDADEYLAASMNPDLVKPVQLLFSQLDETIADAPTPLKGTYVFTISVLSQTPADGILEPAVMVSGTVSGLLGTDTMKRDIYTGLVIGIRWALLIGILTSIITVTVGVLFAVMAAYFGGWVDWVISRLYEVIYLMPVLPFLIVVAAIFKPSIWTIIAVICIFFWSGAFKPVYGMALQIKEETFVEASRALGAGKWRIIFKHIIPILLPYSFAVMALSIPGVIVYEASLSLLGLGDATIVTWGQLLFDALSQGAVINNLWWWVVPPGLMIALMGMSFAFLGTALDKILHPKLKTR